MASPIRVLVADDSELFRKSLCRMLFAEEPFEICGEAGDYAELLKMLGETKPDVILMDIRMPYSGDMNAKTIKTQLSDSCLIALSFATDAETIETAARFGAFTLLEKVNLVETLFPAINECLRQKGKSAFA